LRVNTVYVRRQVRRGVARLPLQALMMAETWAISGGKS
jgi:hypothetical protein